LNALLYKKRSSEHSSIRPIFPPLIRCW